MQTTDLNYMKGTPRGWWVESYTVNGSNDTGKPFFLESVSKQCQTDLM